MSTINNEALILQRTIQPTKAILSAAAARSILKIDFGDADKTRMRDLAAKARSGTLSAADQLEIDAYGRVGSLISILKSQARRSLKSRTATKAIAG